MRWYCPTLMVGLVVLHPLQGNEPKCSTLGVVQYMMLQYYSVHLRTVCVLFGELQLHSVVRQSDSDSCPP